MITGSNVDIISKQLEEFSKEVERRLKGMVSDFAVDVVEAASENTRLGDSVTYVAVTEGEYNSDTGSVTNTEVETSIVSYPKRFTANQYNMPNLIGKEAMEWLIVASDLSTKPSPQDKIKRGSTVYTVDSVKEIIAQGDPVLYKVLAVKG